MVLGVYSDLHCNLPALEALAAETRNRVDLWLCAGDTVGLFPFVNEVLDWQRAHQVVAVRGDHERCLLSGEIMEHSFSGQQALEKQRQALSEHNLAYLETLPEECDLEVDGKRIRLVHALSPAGACMQTDKYLLDPDVMEARHAGVDYLFCGHTHRFTVLYNKHGRCMNPGSLGFPVDAGHAPSALLVDTRSDSFEMLRLQIDLTALKDAIRSFGYNAKLVAYLDGGYQWR